MLSNHFVQIAMAAFSSYAHAQDPIWIETDTGVGFALGQGTGSGPGGIPTPFTDAGSCAVSLTASDGTVTYPDLTNTGGNEGGCNAGTHMAFSDPSVGDVSITYMGAPCGDFGGSCDPVLSVNGANYNMWDASNCNSGKVDNVVNAYDYFRCSFSPTAPGQPLTPGSTPAAAYTPGWCTMHVIQHQKPDPSVDSYTYDVAMYDTTGLLVGSVGDQSIPTDQTYDLDSMLPVGMDITSGTVDDDPISFAYGDQFFDSNDAAHQCSFGGYDGGMRQGDCGFTC